VTGDEDVGGAGGTKPSASMMPSSLTSSAQHITMPGATLGHDPAFAEAG
jgi:hypothetical protein